MLINGTTKETIQLKPQKISLLSCLPLAMVHTRYQNLATE